MGEVLTIKCANGCGAPLSQERLRIGLRTPRGIRCEWCVAGKVARTIASDLRLPPEDAEPFVARAIAWMCESLPNPETTP